LIALTAHQIPDRRPIQVAVGEQVRVGETDSEWPAFVMVTTEAGSGWVPERHLDRAGDLATVRVAYDTTELATSEGESLEALEVDSLSGWIWCRAADGREGWVPDKTLGAE
jgi:uncharacterized protein YgiM (DUF1202 family)